MSTSPPTGNSILGASWLVVEAAHYAEHTANEGQLLIPGSPARPMVEEPVPGEASLTADGDTATSLDGSDLAFFSRGAEASVTAESDQGTMRHETSPTASVCSEEARVERLATSAPSPSVINEPDEATTPAPTTASPPSTPPPRSVVADTSPQPHVPVAPVAPRAPVVDSPPKIKKDPVAPRVSHPVHKPRRNPHAAARSKRATSSAAYLIESIKGHLVAARNLVENPELCFVCLVSTVMLFGYWRWWLPESTKQKRLVYTPQYTAAAAAPTTSGVAHLSASTRALMID